MGFISKRKYRATSDQKVAGSSPAGCTAASGQTEAVRVLLENGADVNKVSDFQHTPLLAAALYGKVDLVKLLIEKGGDVCYRSSAGTAGDIAKARGQKELAELLKTTESKKCR